MSLGIVLVSHVAEVADGLKRLLVQVAKDVPITTGGGLENGEVGTSFERVQAAIEENSADELLVFYDLGSAKMNLEMAIELTEKKVHLYDVAFIEGAYTAAALIQAGDTLAEIEEQLKPLKIK
ncbi:MAG: PTS-dependent dihydroxyacetone kinase phosphotransferase subunit DhaM [Lactobacillales bacterium]|jgi:dihydroxyacetone kinase phosphotransfer subunit|nr:PTS-dependent dihydroxyacetone kinase phosphotransferase subunit DhaM [Lactobacillales bacterium]